MDLYGILRRGGLPALACAALAACSPSGDPASSPLDALPPAAPMNIVAFNIRYENLEDTAAGRGWARRAVSVIDTIKSLQPDIFGCQEVRGAQLRDIVMAFSDGWDFVTADRMEGLPDGADEHCPIFYRTDRFELLGSGHFWLSDSPGEVGSIAPGAALPRIATWVELAPRRRPDDRFLVLNTHWDFKRESQPVASRVIAEFLDARRGAPAVVMGDFNAEPETPQVTSLLSGSNGVPRLRDAAVEAASGAELPGTFHGFSGIPGDNRIDHIFVTSQWRVENARVILTEAVDGLQPSDHFPIIARLSLP